MVNKTLPASGGGYENPRAPVKVVGLSWRRTSDCIQLLDGVSGSTLGVLTALIVADLTNGTGRFNLAQGFVGTLAGIGASLSTTFFGLIVGSFGNVIGFLSITAAALSTVFLAWSLMPETKPSNENGELFGST